MRAHQLRFGKTHRLAAQRGDLDVGVGLEGDGCEGVAGVVGVVGVGEAEQVSHLVGDVTRQVATLFRGQAPALTGVGVSALAGPEFKIEIEAVAVVG